MIQGPTEKITILIVDDILETWENLRKLFYFEADIEIVDMASNGNEAILGGIFDRVSDEIGKFGNLARVTVSDTGTGIPPEDLPHIFDRFYRGEKSRLRSKDGKGFGLGLSIAYWIVRNHDGRIEVDSQVGQGTTFTVWLPLSTDKDCVDPESY